METYAIYDASPKKLLAKVNMMEKLVEEAKPYTKGLVFEKCRDPEVTQEIKDLSALVAFVRYL